MTAVETLHVTTGGDPQGALVAAVDGWDFAPGRVYYVQVQHDSGCPTLSGAPVSGCTCEVVRVERTAR